jgi:DNA-binding beta-propeller fold protein YncE/predicted small secreted protein
MVKKTVSIVLIMAALLLAGCENVAQGTGKKGGGSGGGTPVQPGVVAGRVTSDNAQFRDSDKTLSGLDVQLLQNGTATAYAPDYQANGSYSFSGVPAGDNYSIQAGADKHHPGNTATFSLTATAGKSGVDLKLAKKWKGGVSTVAGIRDSKGYTPNGTLGASAQFRDISGLAVDPAGDYLYVADGGNYRIRRVGLKSGNYEVYDFAGNGTGNHLDASNGLSAEFRGLSSLTMDAAGTNLYVGEAHAMYPSIRKVEIKNNAAVTTIAGSGIRGVVDYETNGLLAQFKTPYGLALDKAGRYLYVVEVEDSIIRKIDLHNNAGVRTIAGDGTAGYADNANGLLAQFSMPFGIILDVTGKLLVTEVGNPTIRTVNPATGGVSTLARLDRGTGTPDGNRFESNFGEPSDYGCGGMAMDAAGNVFVAGNVQNLILKLNTATGEVITMTAGEGDVPFEHPAYLATGPDGSLYVAENDRYSIRKLSRDW